VHRAVAVFGFAAVLAFAPACRRGEKTTALDPVRAIRSRVEPRFRPPEDGHLSPAQIDLYLKVRGAGAGPEADAVRALGIDPVEFDWTRGRIAEALIALDARAVRESALEAYGKGIAALREARRATRDPRAAARLDVEIAALEKERASARRTEPLPPGVARNAALVAPRRAQIESVRP
jgi:hypothetical protein